MSEEIHKFVIASLQDMNYSVEGVDAQTPLGPAGVDLESLSIAELGVRLEDEYAVKFGDEEVEMVASMTVGEFVALVAERRSMVGQD